MLRVVNAHGKRVKESPTPEEEQGVETEIDDAVEDPVGRDGS